LDLMVFHFQNVEKTYTTIQQAFQLSNIQTWVNAALKYCTDCYSPLCSSYLRPYQLKIGKTSRPRPWIHYVLGPQTSWS
jgi:hypothetical protein